MSFQFGREYELTISTPGGLIRRFDGRTTTDHAPLQIQFTVDQSPISERAHGEITVFGLNRSSRKAIYSQFASVVLKAGYRGEIGTIFAGAIENVEVGRDGPNTFVKLYCQSGAENWQSATINKGFGPNTPQKEIILAVAETFGFPVEFVGNFDDLPRAQKGMTYGQKDSKYVMRQLAESFEFTWFVSLGEMLVVKDGGTRADIQRFRYKPTNGLIGSPEITQLGVNANVLLNPAIRPYDQYTIESETGRLTFNGIYYKRQEFPKTDGEGTNEVISLVHEGDFYGDTWQTSLDGRRIGG